MGFQRVIVNADGDRVFAKRAAFAASVAGRFDGQVAGVFARLPNPALSDAAWPALPNSELIDRLIASHDDNLNSQAASLKPVFESAAGGVANAWLEIAAERSGAMVRTAQAASLVVLSQPDEDDQLNFLGREGVSDIVMRCGRPVLFHPYIDAKSDFDRILIAWDGSREAVRALNDSTPFFEGAAVMLLTAAEGSARKSSIDPSHMVNHAQAFGAKATYSEQSADDIRISDAIMSRASDFGANLVVMGGYSHSRFRELILGGTTREILEQMPVPVLMSH